MEYEAARKKIRELPSDGIDLAVFDITVRDDRGIPYERIAVL
jgi:hypothetical protein